MCANRKHSDNNSQNRKYPDQFSNGKLKNQKQWTVAVDSEQIEFKLWDLSDRAVLK